MKSPPPLLVSSLDYERLLDLIERLPDPAQPSISALQTELDRAQVVEPEALPPEVVSMNSRVSFVIEPDGKRFEMTLVYPRDIDGSPDRISVLAPVGAALLGLSVGQTIEWPVPGGRAIHVRILAVTYQPERAGELHR